MPHLWVMATPRYTELGRRLLVKCVAALQLLNQAASVVQHTFSDADTSGIEYINIGRGATLNKITGPSVDDSQWMLVMGAHGCGWVPTKFIS